MAKKAATKKTKPRSEPKAAISEIIVSGYKSISKEQGIEVRHLTILAGANSSGKSSIMQPLLLMKQTLEATYDPGALLINGDNVKFTSSEQFLSRTNKGEHTNLLSISIRDLRRGLLTTCLEWKKSSKLQIEHMTFRMGKETTALKEGMSENDIVSQVPVELRKFLEFLQEKEKVKRKYVVARNRCFLDIELTIGLGKKESTTTISPKSLFVPAIRGLIHVPPLRGIPERAYPVAAIGSMFPGTFEKYVASIIAHWQNQGSKELRMLNRNLRSLGLANIVKARSIDDTQVEIQVGRLMSARRDGSDLVNIADVGFGLSQILPVLVALLAANPGQLVYLEQPEIHLHPRAQRKLATILVQAAKRGVRVVAETHSALLLLAIQTLVAKGRISPDKVKLHWFKRSPSGITTIKSADLDQNGAFGHWPEDFSDVELKAESEYLDTVESRI